MKLKRLTMILLAMALAVSAPGTSHAVLSAVGPVDPANGFPKWYQDANGLTLEFCIPDAAELANGTCLILPANVPNSGVPIAFPANFPQEAFFWSASALMDLPGGNKADLRLAIEGSFFPNGVVAPGNQMAFGRIRLRIDVPSAGTYTVTHPFGTLVFNVTSPGKRAINTTIDVGLTPGDFTQALLTDIGPFLRPSSVGPGGIPDPLVTSGGKTYIIDPALIGLGTPTFVTGGTNGNIFRIDGPNIGGAGVNAVQTDQFFLTGRVFPGVPLNVTRANYARNAGGESVDVWGEVAGPTGPTSSVTATVPGVSPVTLGGNGAGAFFGRINMPAGTLSSVPPPVTVTGSHAGNTNTVLTEPLSDFVTLSQAKYSIANQTLTVSASSSDQTVPPVLTATGLGALASGQLVLPGTAVPPPSVEVTSAAGGRAVLDTAIITSLDAPELVTPEGQVATTAPSYIWRPVNGAIQYSLQVTGSGGTVRLDSFNASDICTGSTPSDTCTAPTVTPLADNATYYWTVRASNSMGYGPWAAAKQFTVTTQTVPGAPTLNLPTGLTGSASPSYVWSVGASAGATQYELYVSSGAGVVRNEVFNAAAICTGNTASDTCTVPTTTPLVSGTTYYWNAMGYNAAGYGPWGSTRTFKVVTETVPGAPVPGSPSGLTADTSPSYTWTVGASTGAAQYLLYVVDFTGTVVRNEALTAALVCSGSTASDTCTATTVTPLAAGTTHYWNVSGFNSAGYGPWGGAIRFDTP